MQGNISSVTDPFSIAKAYIVSLDTKINIKRKKKKKGIFTQIYLHDIQSWTHRITEQFEFEGLFKVI